MEADAMGQSPLEFRIHLQAYIELCRRRDLAPAIAYVKKSLLPAAVAMAEGESTGHMDELNRAMALLAFGPSTTCIIYHVRPLPVPLITTNAPCRTYTPQVAGLTSSPSSARPFSPSIPSRPFLSSTSPSKPASRPSRPPSASPSTWQRQKVHPRPSAPSVPPLFDISPRKSLLRIM